MGYPDIQIEGRLLTQVKHEFNASNKDLYTDEALLAKGKIT